MRLAGPLAASWGASVNWGRAAGWCIKSTTSLSLPIVTHFPFGDNACMFYLDY